MAEKNQSRNEFDPELERLLEEYKDRKPQPTKDESDERSGLQSDAKDNTEEAGQSATDELPESNAASQEQQGPKAPAKGGKRLLRTLRNVAVWGLVTAAVLTLIVNYVFPVVRIYGSSMSSTLVDGDIVIATKTSELEKGDICAFYSGNRVLCKRVIGVENDVIEIDKDGTVYVNGTAIDEPYLKGKSLGDSDVEYPVTVPEGSYFVLGDNRRTSVDSRNSVIGCVSSEQVVGKLLFCVLPLPSFGSIK